MNVMHYVGKFDEATWQLFRSLGMTGTYLRESESGLAAVEQRLSYKKEVFAGSVIDIYSRVVSIRTKTIVFAHDMHDVEFHAIASACEITAVHFDRTTHKAIAFPDRVIEAAAALLE